MRILVVGMTYAPFMNGQAVFSTALAEGLVRRGHDVTMVTPACPSYPDPCVRSGVRILPVGSVHIDFPYPDSYIPLRIASTVREAFRQSRPDIVHIQDHFPICHSAIKMARLLDTGLLGTNHFVPRNWAPYVPLFNRSPAGLERALWMLMRSLYNRLDLAVAPSRTAAEILIRHGIKVPVRSVSCGVDNERFHPDAGRDRAAFRRRYGLDSQATLFLYVGRIDQEKRIDVILHALRLLRRDDIQFAVAGRGAARELLTTQAQKMGLDHRARFIGFVPGSDLCALLNAADIFVMPSEAELLSIATLEAMSCAKPVLLARAQALPELVRHGENGFLFEPGNPADAASRMAMLADHPEAWPAMGAVSRRLARAHGIENTLVEYEQIYSAVRGSHRPGHRRQAWERRLSPC